MRSHLRILLAVAALFAAMAVFSSSALAVETHLLEKTFGPFARPSGVAADETSGNVFVADGGGSNTVKIFGADGGAPSGVASATIEGFFFGGEPSGVAVDNSATSPSKGVLYVVDVGHSKVKKFIRNPGTELYEAAGELVPAGAGFGEPLGAAVDSAGNVFVADYGSSSVVVFNPAGTEIARIDTSGSLGRPSSVALDSAGDLFVQSYGNRSVYKYPVNGSGQIEAGVFTKIVSSGGTGVAVDPATDSLYIALGDHVSEYDANTLAPKVDFGGGDLANSERIVVNSASGAIYVADPGHGDVAIYGKGAIVPSLTVEPTSAISGTKATLNATVNPDGLAVSECKFEYGTTTAYGSTKPCEGAIPTDSNDHLVTAALVGLTPGTTYRFRILATNANGTNKSSGSFETPATVVTGAASAISPPTASVEGTINPEGAAVTECKFEYGATTAYGSSTPCTESPASIGSGESPVAVHANLSGLAFEATYHYRLVASNASGTLQGADRTFETAYPAIEAERAMSVGLEEATLTAAINPKGSPTTYHLEYGTTTSYGASTPEAPIGAEATAQSVSNSLAGLIPATTYHWRIVATSSVGVTEGPDQTFTTFVPSPPAQTDCPNQVFRSGASAVLPDCRAYEQATPVDKHGANVQGTINFVQASAAGNRITFADAAGLPTTGGSSTPPVYLASRGADAWSSNGLLPLTEPGKRAELFGWDDEISAAASKWSSASGPGISLFNTSSGTSQLVVDGSVQSLAAFAADTSHFTFESESILAPGAVSGTANLYDFDHGALTHAGRIPAAPATTCDDAGAPACVPAPEGSFAGPFAWNQADTAHGNLAGTIQNYTQNTISDDGSKVFFTAAGSGQLYMREGSTRTVQISASQAATPDPNGAKPAAFLDATADGSKVFFLSCEKLTDDSTAVSTAAAGCTEAERGQDLYSYDTVSGDLTDLTVDSNTADPQRAGVFGFLGASEDGSHVYFVANGVLAPGASAGDCVFGGALFGGTGSCNLYLAHAGITTFIARLDAFTDDFSNWTPYFGIQQQLPKESRVAAGGTLLFASTRSLTGYDNTLPSASGQCGANASNRCLEIYRYSPVGDALNCISCNPTNAVPTGSAKLQNRPFIVEGAPRTALLTRNLTPDGSRAFFDSPDPLVPADTNGVVDPYEWEAAGTGSCRSTEVNGGCLYLLSSGTSPSASYLADIGASGNDAFFFTGQPLVSADEDQLTDVYDARVGGGLVSQHPEIASPPCLGEACKGASTSAPNDSTAGSASFNGPGNQAKKPVKRCKKQSQKKCKKSKKQKKKKKSKSKQSRGAHNNRGGSK